MELDISRKLLGRPIIYGEVLFDVFPDGKAVLGGAPFNVARHLQGFGLNPLFISRIGNDPEGEAVLKAMTDWGMDTKGLQRDDKHPSGIVKISITEKSHSFEILPNQSYDHINSDNVFKLLEKQAFSLLYHGTLITREKESSDTLNKIIEQTNLPLFVDINLRKPFWNNNLIEQTLNRAKWVKLNDEELAIAMDSEPISSLNQPEESAKILYRKINFDTLIITLGSKGAFIVKDNDCICEKPVEVKNLVDTVGAGDAFSSIIILALHKGWSEKQMLRRALDFSAAICKMRGATTEDQSLYKLYSERWSSEDE